LIANHWRECLIFHDATLHDAIGCLDRAGLQIVMVVAEGDTLIGTVTDGDIRRGLLRGLDLSSSVDAIVQHKPLVVPPQMDGLAALQIMQTNRVHHLPIVNDQDKLVGLYVWDDLNAPKRRPNTMVIMAGGKGMRLRPHTEYCPKPMLLVSGRPMLEHIIERARIDGFDRFIIAIHYLGHVIEEHFGDGGRWNVSIEYLREEVPLGTGGPLSLIPHGLSEPVVVTNGDVLTDVRYSEILAFHVRYEAMATMAVRSYEWQHPFGVVRTNGVDIESIEEKPLYRSNVNAGIYVIDPVALAKLRHGEHCDMPVLFERLRAASQRTIVYPMHEPWLDVGRPDDLERARNQNAA
jgi:dTDP-glucose pyrophosphorylase